MKKIGLIGGMSWESTLEYYRSINELSREKLGGDHSAELVMYSFDFNEIVELQHRGEWERLEERVVEVGQYLKEAGADILVICANTVHKVAPGVEEKVGLPLVHIADSTAKKIKEEGLGKVGLIGTSFVMDEDFYKERLKRKHDIDVLVPEGEEKERLHEIIYTELCRGTKEPSSKKEVLESMKDLHSRGAEGIILGCTEIPLVISQDDIDIPLFETTSIHAKDAVEQALE